MAYQALGLGTTIGDGTGDSIRDGGDKINDNFVEIYTLLGTGTALTSGISATATVVTLTSPVLTGAISFADGSVSAPSITNTGDTNTGIFFSAADTVSVTTGGTKRVDIDSSGLDVTGTITASSGLDVTGAITATTTITGTTLEATGDTAASDNAAIGYTSVEGLILTGQGSTNDVTIKNDTDADVIEIPTGTVNVTMAGTLDVVGDVIGGNFQPDSDTATGDAAAVGYTSVLGLILTGQGSTNDVTLVNDADGTVLSIPTGTTDITVAGTVRPLGDTATGDIAAFGYTSVLGAILTGQGSTNDVTLVNDADATVMGVATGTTTVNFAGDLTVAGTLELAKGVTLDGTPADDHTATGPQTNTFNAGYGNAVMDLVYLDGSSTWLEADSDAAGTSINMLGIALAAVDSGAALNVALPGSFVRDDTFNFTPGLPLYISNTLGAITATKPTGSGDIVRTVGYAITADVIYFNPSSDYVILV